MKQALFFILILFAHAVTASAQNEVSADTITRKDISSKENLLPEVKNYNGFLLDMSLMNITAPKLPSFSLKIPDASKDYNSIFRLNPDATYSQGLSDLFSLSNSRYFGLNPFGLTGFGNPAENLQMGSFKLKNGMRINTYGEYDKDGWKVPNPSALPWEKNNFKGAFELKSANGSFGIRIEVQQGKGAPCY